MRQFGDMQIDESIAPRKSIRSLADLIVIQTLLLCLFLSLVPTRKFDEIIFVKYAPTLMIILAIAIFFTAGVRITALKIKAVNFLIFLAICMLIGSLIPLSQGERLAESYLGRGANIFAVLCGAIVASNSDSLNRISRIFVIGLAFVSVIGLSMLVAKSLGIMFHDEGHILHIETTIFVAGLIWIARRWASFVFRIIILITLVWLSVETGKSTTMLLAGLFVISTVVPDLLERMSSVKRREPTQAIVVNFSIAFLSLATIAAGTAFFFRTISERASRYENDLRIEMWMDRWNDFLNSPVYGSLFTDSPLYHHPLLNGMDLSTHNDYLDILASGGVVGFFCASFAILVVLTNRRFFADFKNVGRSLTANSSFSFVFICYVVSALGNPFLPIPRLAVIVWFSIGVLAVQASTRFGSSTQRVNL